MRVLVAHKFWGRSGGPENLIAAVQKRLSKDGHRGIPFSMQAPDNQDNPYYSCFVDNQDYSPASGNLRSKFRAAGKLLYSLEARQKLNALLDREPVDIAHVHNIYHQITPAILSVLKRRGIPVVMTLHDLKLICPNYKMYAQGRVCEACRGQRYYYAAIKKCVKGSGYASLLLCLEAYVHHWLKIYARNVDRFICPSQFIKDKMVEYGFEPGKLSVIPNGVEVGAFQPAWDHAGTILYFGRLDGEKGVGTLLEAARRLRSVPVVFAGSGASLPGLKDQAAAWGLNNVRFAGFLTGKALEETIQAAMFTVIPSELYENCSIAVLESMAYGKPVIGSRIGGLPEQIEDGVNGLLFEPGNAEDLAQKIDHLASQPALIEAMGRNARKTAETKYSMDNHYNKIIELYSKLLQIKR